MSVIDFYSENCGYLHIFYVSAIHNRLEKTIEGCNKQSAVCKEKDDKGY